MPKPCGKHSQGETHLSLMSNLFLKHNYKSISFASKLGQQNWIFSFFFNFLKNIAFSQENFEVASWGLEAQSVLDSSLNNNVVWFGLNLKGLLYIYRKQKQLQ